MKKFKLAVISAALLSMMAAAAPAGPRIYRNNALTASHVSPPGTHVAMIPPRNAVASSAFHGFELGAAVRIEITESAGVSYGETAGTLTKEGVEALNISFRDSSPVSLNGSQATLVAGVSSSDDSTGALLLVLGSDSMTVFIRGFYRANDKAAEAAVRSSLLSCVFNPAGVKRVSGDYTVSTAGTSFSFSDEIASTRYFKATEKPGNDEGGPSYTVAATIAAVPPEARDSYAAAAMADLLSQYPQRAVVSRRAVTYGGIQGIETIAEFESSKRHTRTASGARTTRTVKGGAYQTLLFDGEEDKIYIFSGIAAMDAGVYIPQFAKITSTFALRR